MNSETNWYRRLDGTILFILLSFFIVSLFFIYSSQQTGQYGAQNFSMKQGVNYLIGFALLFIVARLDMDQIERIAWPSYIVFFFSLVFLKIAPESIAYPVYGAKRWFQIPIVGSIQPSEYFKIALILVAARIMAKHNSLHTYRTLSTDLLLVGKILLVTIPPSLFVYSQPDTGMVMLYLIAIGSMLFLAGINKKILAGFIISSLLFVGLLVYLYFFQPDVIYKQLIPLLKPHQQERVIGWLDPTGNSNEAYQAGKSLLAVGSGEMFGKGLMQGNVYIPEKHTDFIFATVAEEGGFVLASIVVTLFFLLMYRIVIIGHSSETPFGTYICAGIAFSLTAQIFQNIGMVIGIMPVKGISLPFLTYGGSSLFSNMIIMGIILSIRKTYGQYMFSNKNENS
ncbi:rod shape-determining protein RodA [Cytobacillus depressus]|uniref:Rod shape-determining protein RodA n=1 Tax=Cytobacillus depressus TaxID=1602942 RepID=A0A6L3V4D4_9BACI|nr:FtsW/RodA/SpoVE family cell cycle protein [Cytobacillus depressus]KAB2334860.1 rod shape-determining protein RodA [Cytobacillus depressus]